MMRKIGSYWLAMMLFFVSFANNAAGQDSGMVLDQAQQNATYGFWFERDIIRWQEFKPLQASVSRIDIYVRKVGSPGSLRMALKDNQRILWETTILQESVPIDGWLQVDLLPAVTVQPNKSYSIHVWAEMASPNTSNRYFWQGQINSSYARGVSSVEQNWPGYDFAFRTWSTGVKRGKVCYIHDKATATAESFKSLLDANGYATTVVSLNAVPSMDFSACDVIIAGDDTGYQYNWGNPNGVTSIRNSGKPVLGLGEGGASLFQNLGLAINWGNSMIVTSQTSVYAPNPKHAIFHNPFVVPVPRTNIVELYGLPHSCLAEHMPSLPTSVELLGRVPSTYTNHYPITKEDKYLLWGFDQGPESMTQAGKMTFINVVDYVATLAPAPLYLSLNIEDALEGVPVNKIVGDMGEGPTNYTRLEVVTKIMSFSSKAKDNIEVVLNVPGDVLGVPSNTWTRSTNGGAQAAVSYQNMGGGQYKVTTNLSPVYIFPGVTLFYRKQIVWRFLIPNDLTPRNITITAQLQRAAVDPTGSGVVKILPPESVNGIIVTNRKLLYDKLADSQVNGLLARLFTEAQGPPASHSPRSVIYYVERYDSRAYNWDNTAVNYTSEATANVTANAIDDLIEDWYDDATKYFTISLPFIGEYKIPVSTPKYLLIVGNDDIIPFYRYDDPYNDEVTWSVTSNVNPAVRATDNDFFFTDNPYMDVGGGTGWQTGDVELWTGRLLGETAQDMHNLLVEAVNWNNGRRGGAVMASVEGWELGLEPDDGRVGEIADLYNVPALLRGKGFAVRNDDVPTSEVRTIDVMPPWEGGDNSWNTNFRNAANNAAGMDIFFIGGHNNHDHAAIPGDDFSPDDTPTRYTRFDDDHPIAMIVGCHGGTPVPDIGVNGGADHNMVYDLIREGARAYIGATGFSYGSPNNLHRNTWGERLIQGFFGKLLKPTGGNSMAIGKAMAEAKRDYTFGFGSSDALDRKTVTEFHIYGVPWSFVYYPNFTGASDKLTGFGAQAEESGIVPAFATQAYVAEPLAAAGEPLYSKMIEIRVERYTNGIEYEGGVKYDLLSVPGGDMAVEPGHPVLPFIESHSMPLPFGAKIQSVRLAKWNGSPIGRFNIPNAKVKPWTEGGLQYTTQSDIREMFPATMDLVRHQMRGDEVLFTVFPIQHNPATKDTVFYDYFQMEVSYTAPIHVAVSEFSLNQDRYLPGEPINAMARVDNIGGADETLWARLSIFNEAGETVAQTSSRTFVVRAGGAYNLGLSLAEGLGNDGGYTARLELMKEKTALGGASEEFSVLGGEIIAFSVPRAIRAGEEGFFDITFENFKPQTVKGTMFITIQDGEGGYRQDLPARGFTADSLKPVSASFSWRAPGTASGKFTATAVVVADGQSYGPKTADFEVIMDACEGDLDRDLDIDRNDMAIIASEFGRANCQGDCLGNIEGDDADVDGMDLLILAVEIGRSNCPGL